MRKRNL